MGRNYNRFQKPELIHSFVDNCAKAGLDVVITSVDRTYQEQTAIFAQGREPLETVNALRKIAGLWLISEEENKNCVTWTMNSEHIINLEDMNKDNDLSGAFDFAVKDKDGKITWDLKVSVTDDGISSYSECALIGEALGLYSGMRFKKPDFPHLQIKPIA